MNEREHDIPTSSDDTNPYDLIVYGASSFVGQIVTRYLAERTTAHEPPLRWAIAGRSQAKLENVRASLGAPFGSLPIVVAEAADRDALRRLCKRTRVVISTVGPYATYGEPLVATCAQTGTDYCDLTGEAQWIRKMIAAYEPVAVRSGARIVNSCGFDSVPSDMGVFFLQREARRRHDAPAAHVKMRVKSMKGGASGGTVASIVNLVKEAVNDPELRRELGDPYSLCPPSTAKTRQHQVVAPQYDADFRSWIAPFVMAAINERIVLRSSALSQSYGDGFAYNEGMLTGPAPLGILAAGGVVAAMGAFMTGAAIAPVRELLERYVLPKPGSGPSPEMQRTGHFDIRFFGRTSGGETIRVKVTGDRDPGYGSTAKMLGEAALGLAFDHVANGAKIGRGGGFWTPATMFDDRYVDRLTRDAGLRFEAL